MTELFPPSLLDQVACAERELDLRRRVYPRWTAAGRMTQERADREIACMEAIVGSLRRLRDKETRTYSERRKTENGR